jgi:hypothetical protein
VAPVVTRHVLDGLAPTLRPLALELTRDGSPDGRPDPARIVVLSRGSFEVASPQR